MQAVKRFMRAALIMAAAPTASRAQTGTDIYLFELHQSRHAVVPGNVRNITARTGYDNQPWFTPDSRYVLYTSNRGAQTDIYRYNISSGVTQQLTSTVESEYSPTVVPAGDGFTVIRVEADSAQRLWKFPMDGSRPTLIVPNVQPVGYQAWGDDHTVAMFVLGAPPTLQLMDLPTGMREFVAGNIGRSLHAIPGEHAISFTQRDVDNHVWIRKLDLDDGRVYTLIEAIAGSQDYTWMPGGGILMGSGSRLLVARPGGEWMPFADLSGGGVASITRLAISPDGRWLAVVGADSGH